MSDTVYIVKSGDSLSKIASKYNVKGGYQALASYNGISNPNLINVGQKINIPGGGNQTTAATSASKPASSSSASTGKVVADQPLADASITVANSMGGTKSQGLCATGVARAVEKVHNFHPYGNGNSIGAELMSKGNYKEVGMSLEEGLQVPGVIFSWQQTGTELGKIYGHAAVSQGDGKRSSSDYIERDTVASSKNRTGLKVYAMTSEENAQKSSDKGTASSKPVSSDSSVKKETAPAQNTSAVTTYTVKSGDTLSGIANKFGVSGGYKALAEYNGISNPNVINVGQVIKIPGSTTSTANTATTSKAPESTSTKAPESTSSSTKTDTSKNTNTNASGILSKSAAEDAMAYNKRNNQGICEKIQGIVGTAQTGDYDLATVNAIAAWQKSMGLTVDGQFGPASKAAAGMSKSAGTKDASQNVSTIYNHLVETTFSGHPLKKSLACGMLGNIYQESLYNPAAEETPEQDANGKGLVQWTYGSRRKGLYKYCDATYGEKSKWQDLKKQLEYIDVELTNSMAGEYAKIQRSLPAGARESVESARLAALYISKYYEAPNEAKAKNDVRQNKAEEHFKNLAGESSDR